MGTRRAQIVFIAASLLAFCSFAFVQVDPTQLCAEQAEKDQTPKQKRRLDFVRWVAAYQAMMLAADAAEVCEILCDRDVMFIRLQASIKPDT